MALKLPVYLDHHATTPVDDQVFAAMRPYFTEVFGNASSRSHACGWEAEEAVETARQEVARSLGAHPDEVVFTSGGTESNTLALRGVLSPRLGRHPAPHLVTIATEHSSVLANARALEAAGADLTVVPVGPDGRLDPDDVRAALTPRTVLVSVMTANNEIGTLAPIAEIGRITRAHGALFHTDATQALGALPVDVEAFQCDLLSLSAHKIYGPKGIGALYVRRNSPPLDLAPLMHGGGHEYGLRPGTLNVPGIVGLGKACTLATARRAIDVPHLRALRDLLLARLREGLGDVRVNGTLEARLAHNLNVTWDDLDGEALFLGLRDLAVSNGSACHSAHRQPSHVLRALGLSHAQAHASVRFGLGRSTSTAEIHYAADRVIATVTRLRAAVPSSS